MLPKGFHKAKYHVFDVALAHPLLNKVKKMHLWCRKASLRFIVYALESVMENAMTKTHIAVTSWYQACETCEPKCQHSFWTLSHLQLAPNCFLNLFWSNWSFHLDPHSIFWYPSPFPVLFWKAQPGRASNPILSLPKPDISCQSKLIFGRPPPRKGNRGVVAVWWR